MHLGIDNVNIGGRKHTNVASNDSYPMVNQGNNARKHTGSSIHDAYHNYQRKHSGYSSRQNSHYDQKTYKRHGMHVKDTSMTDIPSRDRGKTFNNALIDAVAGNDILLDDVVQDMATKGGPDPNDIDLYEDGDESDDLLDTMDIHNNNNPFILSAKISEMAPSKQSGQSSVYIEVDGAGNIDNESGAKMIDINQSRNHLGDNLYEETSDEILEEMETAGFIDGDYNELEYEDEYYEEDDDDYYDDED